MEDLEELRQVASLSRDRDALIVERILGRKTAVEHPRQHCRFSGDHQIGDGRQPPTRPVKASAVRLPSRTPCPRVAQLLDSAREAFTSGIGVVSAIGTLVFLVMAAVTFTQFKDADSTH